MRGYIKTGEADAALIAFLAKHIEVFAPLAEYNEALVKLQQGKGAAGTPAPVDLSSLEKGLLQEMPFLRLSGAGPEGRSKEAEGGVKTSYFSMLCSMLGTEPAKYFQCRVAGVFKGGAESGMAAPLTLKPGQSVPEELKSSYLTTQQFAQLITVLDRTLAEVVMAFFERDKKWWAENGIKTSNCELIRALLPQNPAAMVLYPKERTALPGEPDKSSETAARVSECYKNGKLAEVAANQLRLSQQALSQENLTLLINTLDRLMPLLPFDIYELVVTNDRIGRLSEIIGTDKSDWERRKNAGVQHTVAVRKAESLRQSLRNNFGYDSKQEPELNKACIAECMNWLGPGFSFLEEMLLRKSTLLSPV